MSFVACSVDGLRPREKPATLYWAWFVADGSRRAYKQHLCVQHYVERIVPLDVAATERWNHCPCCGIDTTDDVDGLYLTVYLPGSGKQEIELACCPSCAARTRASAMEGALELEDRQLGAAAEAPKPSSASVWAALGRD